MNSLQRFLFFREPLSAFLEVLDMIYAHMMRHAPKLIAEQNRQEIERAIDNVKRTALDKWFRKEWYKTAARQRWSKQRRQRWQHSRRHSGGAGPQRAGDFEHGGEAYGR